MKRELHIALAAQRGDHVDFSFAPLVVGALREYADRVEQSYMSYVDGPRLGVEEREEMLAANGVQLAADHKIVLTLNERVDGFLGRLRWARKHTAGRIRKAATFFGLK